MVSRPVFSCETDFLRQFVVRTLAVRSPSEEGEDVVDVRVIDLDGNIAVGGCLVDQ